MLEGLVGLGAMVQFVGEVVDNQRASKKSAKSGPEMDQKWFPVSGQAGFHISKRSKPRMNDGTARRAGLTLQKCYLYLPQPGAKHGRNEVAGGGKKKQT